MIRFFKQLFCKHRFVAPTTAEMAEHGADYCYCKLCKKPQRYSLVYLTGLELELCHRRRRKLERIVSQQIAERYPAGDID